MVSKSSQVKSSQVKSSPKWCAIGFDFEDKYQRTEKQQGLICFDFFLVEVLIIQQKTRKYDLQNSLLGLLTTLFPTVFPKHLSQICSLWPVVEDRICLKIIFLPILFIRSPWVKTLHNMCWNQQWQLMQLISEKCSVREVPGGCSGLGLRRQIRREWVRILLWADYTKWIFSNQ